MNGPIRSAGASQGGASQGRSGQGGAAQGEASQGESAQGRVAQGWAGQGRVTQGRAGQGRVAQGQAGQGRSGQGRSGRGGAGQGGSGSFSATVALADRVATLSAEAVGGEGTVRVTVAGSGLVTGLALDDRIHDFTGEQLSAEIMRTVKRAQASLSAQVAIAVEETVGIGSETGKAVLDSFSQRFPLEQDETEEPPVTPVMPTPPPFPSFENTPTLPHQAPGNGFESGRDSRAR